MSGDVPLGAGLSSSAALEVAALTLVQAFSPAGPPQPGGPPASGGGGAPTRHLPIPEAARVCQRAEHDFAGTRCGIMDQFISLAGRRGHALFLDCRSLGYELVPLRFSGCCVVVADSQVRRGLADSEYNARRAQCEEGVRRIRALRPEVHALRDVPGEVFQELQDRLPADVARRCRHVVGENQRVLGAVAAARSGDAAGFGRLMVESHRSLRDDYAVSCRELDVLADAALAHGALGSRMTGAGFGGCTVSLVQEAGLEGFVTGTRRDYRASCGRTADVYVFSPADGAAIIS